MHPTPADELRSASFADLGATTLYAILRLRSEVFVVEQACAYLDLDGLDQQQATWHVWMARGDEIRAYLRILDDGEARRIGRVVTARDARGAGLAGELMRYALGVAGNRPTVLAAQAHLTGFYGRYGFRPAGPEYLEDGIPHVPMARPPDPGGAAAGEGRRGAAAGEGTAGQGSAATSSATERRRPV